jgi:plastocyanin
MLAEEERLVVGEPKQERRRFKLRMFGAASMVLIMGAACSGRPSSAPPTSTPAPSGLSTSPPAPTCGPRSSTLEIAAQKGASPTAYAFDKECLAVPAQERFTIIFDNRDAESHNLHILDQPGGTSFFVGMIVTGPVTVTYRVKPLHAGSYYFRCDVHPLRMNGTLLVEE